MTSESGTFVSGCAVVLEFIGWDESSESGTFVSGCAVVLEFISWDESSVGFSWVPLEALDGGPLDEP